jgi:4-diphosphocytidyl-2-C-methyl-D-erythritol kinase
MKLKTWAKLNLCLHVLPPKNKAGLYDVNFINCQTSLFDEISLKKIKDKIEIWCQYQHYCRCDKKDSCRQQKNLVLKAAEILKQDFGQPHSGVEIIIKKNIPPAAGLAGGSADAATVLSGLNKLWQLNLNQEKLLEVAGQLGMDTRYCLIGGLAFVSGRKGEKIQPLKHQLPRLWLVIITPEQEKPSTAWAYQHLEENKIGKSLNSLKLLKEAIKRQDFEGVCKGLHNDFELLMIQEFPVVGKIKQQLLENGAQATTLAGSGLSVVGFFKDKEKAQKAYNKMSKIYKKCFMGRIV